MPVHAKDANRSTACLKFKSWSIARRTQLRMIAFVVTGFVVAAFVASGPAAAQSWEEYSYPDYAFSVAFPATPQVETTTYQVVDNRSVPAHVYTVRRSNSILMVTVADLA